MKAARLGGWLGRRPAATRFYTWPNCMLALPFYSTGSERRAGSLTDCELSRRGMGLRCAKCQIQGQGLLLPQSWQGPRSVPAWSASSSHTTAYTLLCCFGRRGLLDSCPQTFWASGWMGRSLSMSAMAPVCAKTRHCSTGRTTT